MRCLLPLNLKDCTKEELTARYTAGGVPAMDAAACAKRVLASRALQLESNQPRSPTSDILHAYLA